MRASPLPVVNSKATGPFTVNWRSKLPSTPECETQPAMTVAVKITTAKHPIRFVRVI